MGCGLEGAEEKFSRGLSVTYTLEWRPRRGLREFCEPQDWLTRIYGRIAGSPIDIHISKEMRGVFDRLVTRRERLEAGLPGSILEAVKAAGVTAQKSLIEEESGVGQVQGQGIQAPEIDAPFALSAQQRRPGLPRPEPTLFQDAPPPKKNDLLMVAVSKVIKGTNRERLTGKWSLNSGRKFVPA